eukprot:3446655-Rhodomonas_salina.1
MTPCAGGSGLAVCFSTSSVSLSLSFHTDGIPPKLPGVGALGVHFHDFVSTGCVGVRLGSCLGCRHGVTCAGLAPAGISKGGLASRGIAGWATLVGLDVRHSRISSRMAFWSERRHTLPPAPRPVQGGTCRLSLSCLADCTIKRSISA